MLTHSLEETIMVLSRLPPEIVLYLLSYLPISSLSQLYSVSRTWNTFLLHHEATIYHRAAFLHGFIDGDSASLESVKSSNKYSERVLADVDSWKKLCTYISSLSDFLKLSSMLLQVKSASEFAMHGMVLLLRKRDRYQPDLLILLRSEILTASKWTRREGSS